MAEERTSATARLRGLGLDPSHDFVLEDERGDCWVGIHTSVVCAKCGIAPLGWRCFFELPHQGFEGNKHPPKVLPQALRPCTG